jgi:hypothetical protein
MNKLLTRYIDSPTHKNALAIRAHTIKHPMAQCMLSTDHADILRWALNHAENGDKPANYTS